MQIPGGPSLIFLFFLLVLVPAAALRSARHLRAMRRAGDDGEPGAPALRRETIWTRTIIVQGMLFGLAWYVGSGFGYRVFAAPEEGLGSRDLLAGLAVLAALLVLRQLGRLLRSPAERRATVVHFLAPRTAPERVLWACTVLAAGVGEEAAYRGVGWAILTYSLGNAWAAALVCAAAFTLAHAPQGWKSAVVILPIALLLHVLVAVTGTLLVAMAVHIVYDFVVGHLINKEATA